MAVLPEPVDCFSQLKDLIQPIPKERFAILNMPTEEAVQEGWRVTTIVDRYKPELMKSDINPQLLDTVGLRTGAFAYTASMMDSHIKLEVSHKEIFQKLKTDGYALRRKLFEDFEYIFRMMQDVLNAILRIKEGKGDLDMIKDLYSLFLLANEYRQRLIDAHFDMNKVTRLNSIYLELSALIATLDIDPQKVDASKSLMAQAWTYLWEALSEIYAAGRFVFSEQPEIKELFYIDYRQEIGKIRTTTEKTETQIQPAATVA
ncbi:MAG TPA: hypothetical protein VHO70_23825 [Chitinispirillaceae bacterium]|nr:hypothetical protein [Chitinispirillaceae bacterium]